MFDLAVRYRAGIDIHLHDGGELGFFELGQIAERCRAHGLAADLGDEGVDGHLREVGGSVAVIVTWLDSLERAWLHAGSYDG